MIEFLNQFGRHWVTYFGASAFQGTVFLGLIFLVLHRLRNAPARVRYAVGLVGLFKLLLPPFLRVPMLASSPEPLHSIPESISTVMLIPMPAGGGISAGIAAPLTFAGFMAAAWAAVALVHIAVSFVSTARLALSLRRATPIDGEIDATTGRGVSGITGKRGIRLFMSDRIAMPLSLGVFPKRIFVPRTWDTWSADCRRMIIQHEMAHINRHDGVVQVFQIAAQALYWFHPLVWLLNRRLGECREMACDDASIGVGRSSSVAYSRYLVEIAESMIRDPIPCGSASALIRQKNELLNRVRYQMKGGTIMRTTRTAAAVVIVGLLLLTLPMSWYIGGASTVRGGEGGTEVMRHAAAVHGNAGAGDTVTRGKVAGRIVEIRIAAGDDVRIDGKRVSLGDLPGEMKRFTGGEGDKPVIKLVCNPDVSMGTIYRLQSVLRELDLMKMNYFTMEGEGLPLMLPPLDVKKRLEDIPLENIAVIVIGAGDTMPMLLLDDGKIKPSNIREAIEKRLLGMPALIVWIRTTDEARYGDFVTVLEEVKKAGAMRILVNADGAPLEDILKRKGEQ
jgi:beta-lactamase regulating signal transducer with metallopeptidase domain/biopolymer transport protein ExbD